MNPLFAASGLESIITLLVFIGIAVVSTWLKKKQQPEDEAEPWPGQETHPAPPSLPGSPSPRPQRPTKTAGWDEELRRLLEGDEPTPQPPPVVYQAPRPAARPVPKAPPPVPRPAPVIIRGTDEDMDKGLPVRMPSLTQSEQAYQKASRLQSSMAEHLREISDKVATHTASQKVKRLAPGPNPAIALVRNHASIQSAVIASVILGPPRSLESQL